MLLDTSKGESLELLLELFISSRKYSTQLISGLTPEDCQSQSMPEASPIKWHLAHVTWFYEVMVLKQFEVNFEFWNPQYAVLFNSYYNLIGDKHPRAQRGLLTRPGLDDVLSWRANIDKRVVHLLTTQPTPEIIGLVRLGINHEQQHQELMLTDLQHLFFNNSLYPSLSNFKGLNKHSAKKMDWIHLDPGLYSVGFNELGFHFDNEGPQHKVYIQPCALSKGLVTNDDWLRFIHSGGYNDSRWWLDEGWAWVQREQIQTPLYWIQNQNSESFSEFSLSGCLPLEGVNPVRNISYFEADAYASWANKNVDNHLGVRLPTEFEWEVFAKTQAHQFEDMFQCLWQWTSSSYSAYPGYRPWSGLAGEYNGKFMVNQMVLRGSSSFTVDGHSRPSYRNFFPAQARWQMTGLRLAKDL